MPMAMCRALTSTPAMARDKAVAAEILAKRKAFLEKLFRGKI